MFVEQEACNTNKSLFVYDYFVSKSVIKIKQFNIYFVRLYVQYCVSLFN